MSAIFIVIMKVVDIEIFGETSTLGFAMTGLITSGGILSFGTFTFSETAKGFAAVERIYEYIDDKNFEADFDIPKCPIENWPSEGKIQVGNLHCRYRPDLPKVLNGISFEINTNEKVAIVGRTGSGKSTIMLA